MKIKINKKNLKKIIASAAAAVLILGCFFTAVFELAKGAVKR